MKDFPPLNQGDDIAGTVHTIGENVYEFKPGDRVFAFHEMLKPGGSYAEYGIAWAHTTALLPPNISFEDGAAIPLAALTAAVGLYASDRLGLPQPWSPMKAGQELRLLIYGAGSAVGSYALQLAVKSNLHPIIAVAGKARSHVEQFLDRSRGDTIVDYRDGDEAVVKGIQEALGGKKLLHAFDAVSEKGSVENIAKVLSPDGGKTTFVLPPPGKDWSGVHECFEAGVKQSMTNVGSVHSAVKDLGFVYMRYFSRGLSEGWFKAQPQEVIKGGLGGVEEGLQNLKDGKASAVKYVFRIGETDGAGSGK